MTRELRDWNLLRTFLEVARKGSIQRASGALARSRPTIGRELRQLEDAVGHRLMIRSAYGIELTEAGCKVMRIAEEMEADARQLSEAVAGRGQMSGTVRFRGTDAICGIWLPILLQSYHDAYPEITVAATCVDFEADADRPLLNADLAILDAEPTDSDVCVVKKGYMVIAPCAARGFVETHGVPRTLDDAYRLPLLILDKFLLDASPWQKIAGALRRHPEIVLRTNRALVLERPLRSGLGMTMAATGFVRTEPDLVSLPVEELTVEIPIWLVSRREVKDLPPVRALIGQFKKLMSEARTAAHLSAPHGKY